MDQKTLIGAEIAREEDMLLAGLRRYWGISQHVATGDNAESSASQSDLLRSPEEAVIHRYGPYFLKAFQEMHEDIERGMGRLAKWDAPALFLTPEHLCLITFKALLPTGHYSWGREAAEVRGGEQNLHQVATSIADQTWHLLHYMKARDEHDDVWKHRSRLIKNWTVKKQRRFIKEVEGMMSMPQAQKLAFGIAMIQCVTDAVSQEQIDAGEYFVKCETRRVAMNRTIRVLTVNPQILRDMEEDHELRQWLRPKWEPMVCAPTPWSHNGSEWTGGYLMPGMQMRFVRSTTPGYGRFGTTEPGCQAVTAINRLQSTPYTVNKDVYDVMRLAFYNDVEIGDLPPHSKNEFDFQLYEGVERDEEGKCTPEFAQHLRAREEAHSEWAKNWADRMRMVMRLDMAKDLMKYPAYWLVVTMDFRGRCYTSTEMLSPQGSDFDKALCCFRDAKPYTESGRRWMKIQIANLFGEDKISFDERVAWFDEHEPQLRAIAEDPIANKWWSDDGDDKKKWQLLASILDYFREDNMNQVAVQMDGSCNGIQHWSAIGRDSIGAKATNLLPSDAPCDLYSEVAASANRFLEEDLEDDWHKAWREQGVSRKCAKRPCMTYPYGVTLRGCVDSLKADGFCDWAGDNKGRAAQYIGQLLMERAIPDVVSASYQFMAWAKEIAKQANEAGTYLEWVTPIGTLVRHNYYEEEITRLNVGERRVVICVSSSDNPILSRGEMVSGVAPNFVHSLDAAHMLLTINAMWHGGLRYYSMIHDSYGCHASDVDEMQRHIREQFVWMYTTYDPAQQLADATALRCESEVINPPTSGQLDINKVLEAPYFFA